MESDWENQVACKEMDILEEITGKGGKIAYQYRSRYFILIVFTLNVCEKYLGISYNVLLYRSSVIIFHVIRDTPTGQSNAGYHYTAERNTITGTDI